MILAWHVATWNPNFPVGEVERKCISASLVASFVGSAGCREAFVSSVPKDSSRDANLTSYLTKLHQEKVAAFVFANFTPSIGFGHEARRNRIGGLERLEFAVTHLLPDLVELRDNLGKDIG
jgi:hypothetical protein